jgi:hypothetical protein
VKRGIKIERNKGSKRMLRERNKERNREIYR